MTDERTVLAVAVHLASALEQHRQRCERDGRGIPDAVLALEAIARFRVTGGQGGSKLAAACGTTEPVRHDPRILTYMQAARLLAVSESSVKRLIAAGDLAKAHIGGKACIRVSDLDEYVIGLGAAREAIA